MGILSNFDIANPGESILYILQVLIIVVLSLTLHEWAHGFAAYKLGDYTAKITGRLSLNPLRHLDPFGFLCMLLFGFGWAKPVPIDSRHFKNPKRDFAISALAGPLMNILLAFFALLPYEILYAVSANGGFRGASELVFNIAQAAYNFFFMAHWMNLSLAIFNLIPIPPLDGSRILYVCLPAKLYFGVMKYERFIQIAIIIALYVGLLDKPLLAATSACSRGMQWLWELIPIFR